MTGGRGDRSDEGGFTLIELMMVVLIIAVLLAIAIPTFVGTKNRAHDRATHVDLRNAMATARTFVVENEGFYINDSDALVTAADLQLLESQLNFTDPGNASAEHLSVNVEATGRWMVLVKKSYSGRWYCIFSDDQTHVRYGQGASEAAIDEESECQGASW